MPKILEIIAVVVVVTSLIGAGVLLAGGPGSAISPAETLPEASTQSDRTHQDHMVTSDPEAPGRRF
jgi:hypothetical protein